MQTYNYTQLREEEKSKLLLRPSVDYESAKEIAETIIEAVKLTGDDAIRSITKKYDSVLLENIEVGDEEIAMAESKLDPELKQAINVAFKNIKAFYSEQKPSEYKKETMPGVLCYSQTRAIERVGLYVPGGTAPLPSTALMLGIPALLAGSTQVVLCTPPNKDGSVNPSILYAAQLCGISKIYKVGGAQSIAAMAYGTKTIPKVDKIFGPGNQYVSAAKLIVSIDPSGAQIDMLAGPSEVLVIADQNARPDFVAADLLSQAEHGVDSQVILVSNDSRLISSVDSELEIQLEKLSRKDIAAKALEKSFSLLVSSIDEAISFSNDYAPEHLIINANNAESLVNQVQNAGSVFLGQYSCESAGDYASGTNHSLPTSGLARSTSGVNVANFQKSITFQIVTKDGAANVGPIVATIAAEEGLDAHIIAMEKRYV